MATLVSRGKTLILFALEREAKPFRRAVRGRADVHVAVSGVGAAAVRATLARLFANESFDLVLMAGFCGALRVGLPVGEVIVPAEVVAESGRGWPCAALPEAWGRLLTMPHLVADPFDKRSLADLHDADIVDMESAAAAEMCSRLRVPFAAVRAVSDSVDTALSPTLVRLLAGGSVSWWKALLALVQKPPIAFEFWQLARNTHRAAKHLAKALVQILDASQNPEADAPGLASTIPRRNSRAFWARRSPS